MNNPLIFLSMIAICAISCIGYLLAVIFLDDDEEEEEECD